jgi:anti-sigma factor RsiW
MTDVVTCASGVERLMDYLEGVLPSQTAHALEAHVAGCERCRAYLESYRATPRIFKEATTAALPAAVEQSLRAFLWAKRR